MNSTAAHLQRRARHLLGKWMVPLDVEKPFSSFLNASTTETVGNKLHWFENAANHTSTPLYLNAGIPC